MELHKLSLGVVFLLISGITLVGCARPGPGQAGGGKLKTAEQSAEAEARESTVTTIGPDRLAAVVDKYRGKVLLIDYWATWCEPCKEFFPHTVALSRELGELGLAVVSLSLDDVEDEPAVRSFLTANRATFENLRAGTGASPESVIAFGIEKGAIPFLQLYDRTGKLRKTFPAPVRPADVEKAVRQLLAEHASSA
jgi:thiol-disulfide isomerase/thioredoxin